MTPTDPGELRSRIFDTWERSAPGWERRADYIRAFGAPVAHWLAEAVGPQPGHHVVELAAGLGEVGLLIAELVAPGGSVLISDQSEAMVRAARRRASAAGIGNVDFKVVDAEWIDLPLASVDGVVCRWGLMLMVDPAAALREARRVLRPGGRLAVAVWDAQTRNPWATLPGRALASAGVDLSPAPGEPGMFALAEEGQLHKLLEEAGFLTVDVQALDFECRLADVDEWWLSQNDLARPFAEAVAALDANARAGVQRELAKLAEPWLQEDGALALPARSLVAVAEA